jgi:hypothetical protein
MGIGGGFGLGFGIGNNNSEISDGNESSVTEDISENSDGTISSEKSETDNTIRIEINDTDILVNGVKTENTDVMKEYLLEINTADSEYIIYDNHAVKSVYDDVKAVLDSLAYEYSEE